MNHPAASTFYDLYWEHRTRRGDITAPNRIKLRHEQTIDFIRRQFPKPSSARVLDVGCGDGIIGSMLTPLEYGTIGVDVSGRALELAQRHYAEVRALDLDRDETPEGWQSAFDAVVCLEVLEHIEEPRRAIERIHQICKPGGVAIFSFPNLFSWKNRLMFLRGRWPAEYCTYDPREHLHAFELPTFRDWVIQSGFSVLGTAITPDLPRFSPLRKLMFRMRNVLSRIGPSLWAMQIVLFTERPKA